MNTDTLIKRDSGAWKQSEPMSAALQMGLSASAEKVLHGDRSGSQGTSGDGIEDRHRKCLAFLK